MHWSANTSNKSQDLASDRNYSVKGIDGTAVEGESRAVLVVNSPTNLEPTNTELGRTTEFSSSSVNNNNQDIHHDKSFGTNSGVTTTYNTAPSPFLGVGGFPGGDIQDKSGVSSMTFHKKSPRTFTWTLILLTLIVASTWLCIVFFLLPSQPKHEEGHWAWPEPEDPETKLNQRPIIGVMSQEYKYYDWDWYSSGHGGHHNHHNSHHNQHDSNPDKIPKPDGHRLYIAGSYISYVEGAGARAVPILANGNETYLRMIFKSVNGLLFPGGAVPLDNSLYAKSGRFLLQLAKEANDRGDHFPVWGTCLGFEFLIFTAAGGRELRTRCGAMNVSDRLKFTEAASKSRLYSNARKSVIAALGTKKVTVNFHKYCVTPENFTKFGVEQEYTVLSLNYDPTYKLNYVSSAEHKRYPFYVTQFHPEKVIYEWNTKETIPHTQDAIEAGQYFANFLVAEAKKSNHTFGSEEEENQYLIYNYQPEFTGSEGATSIQTYFFPLDS